MGDSRGRLHPSSEFDALLRDAAQTPAVVPRATGLGRTLLGGRFVLEQRLGEGGMGVVYEAFDEKTESRVALKVLSRVDAAGVYRFKKEFRSLAGVVHENLVALHELFADDGAWFFTMDLVHGVPFSEWVRPDAALALQATEAALDEAASRATTLQAPVAAAPSTPSTGTRVDVARLRSALAELAAGIAAIHDAGKLHRDLKPSNVLVTSDGRVVILDFGLVGDATDGDVTQTIDRAIAGTPAYMAPEQARAERATPASDWYALGVMMYEALTGVLPFSGSSHEVLMGKLARAPEPLRNIAPDAPAELAELCMDLLRRDAAERPTRDRILGHLRAAGGKATSSARAVAQPEPAFVGRRAELGTLWAAFEAARHGETRPVLVRGTSGIGKTVLVERLLDRTVSESGALVLRGRCYEREEVPFKALDGIIDALTRHLAKLDPTAAALLLPRDVHTLTRVFPVLGRVPVVAHARSRPSRVEEPIELRRVAFAALRELLQRLGDQQPLVLFIDDLQWADAASARVLSALLEPPDAPAMLLVGTYRSDEVERSGCVSELLAADGRQWKRHLVQIELGELEPDEALALASALVGEETTGHAGAIAAEAGGHPYFVAELARSVRAEGGQPAGADSSRTLDAVISERAAALPDGARRLLEVAALCGRPLPMQAALDAAGIARGDRAPALTLVAGHLARTTRVDASEAIEAYHDRVRSSVTACMSTEQRVRLHSAIVRALDVHGRADPELLVEHLAGSGNVAAALEHALKAARAAAEAYAFEAAASLYQRALAWITDPEARLSASVRLAEALRDAGRAAEAGWAYLEAGEASSGAQRSDLRRLGAEQLVLAGHIEAGISIFDEALQEQGLEPLSSTPIGPDPRWLELLGAIAQRGLEFQPRSESDIAEADLRRIDLFWSIAWGLNVASFRGGAYVYGHLLAALDAGEPFRVVRALSMYSTALAALQAPGVEEVVRRTEEAARLGDDRSDFWVDWARFGLFSWHGRPHMALPHVRRAEQILRALGSTASKELGSVHFSLCFNLIFANELPELVRCLPEWLRDAEERHDLFSSAWLRVHEAIRCIVLDDVEGAVKADRRALAAWNRPKQDDWLYPASLQTRLTVDLYAATVTVGSVEELERVATGPWGSMRLMRSYAAAVTGRARLRLAEQSTDLEPHMERLDKCIRRIERVGAPSQLGFSYILRAAIANLRGHHADALEILRAAIERADDPDWAFTRAPLRRRFGELLASDEGLRFVDDANEQMRRQGIRNPDRWTAMVAPGFSHGTR